MIPYRLALAGGWIDQPFVSRENPEPPGSMVVVSLEPSHAFADRSGMATSTRKTAERLWGDAIPAGEPEALMRELYAAENAGRSEPSGSQDMAGLIFPGVSRLDYDFRFEGGVFPAHIESNQDRPIAAWLERIIRLVPVAPRPEGYEPLGRQNLNPGWIRRLGRSGKDCFDAIVAKDLDNFGASLNECMRCWEAILPQTVVHPALPHGLKSVLADYQTRFAGAMFSGCGGGYVIVASDEPVPDSLPVVVRL